MNISGRHNQRIAKMTIASVYPMNLAKVDHDFLLLISSPTSLRNKPSHIKHFRDMFGTASTILRS